MCSPARPKNHLRDIYRRSQPFQWLDVAPGTITGQVHRASYGSDGDYFSKQNAEEIIEVVREMMSE